MPKHIMVLLRKTMMKNSGIKDNKQNQEKQSTVAAVQENKILNNIFDVTSRLFSFVSLKFRLKARYFLTRRNNVRLRYVTVLMMFAVLGMSAMSLLSQKTEAPFDVAAAQIQSEPSDPDILEGEEIGRLAIASIDPIDAVDYLIDDSAGLPLDREIEIKPGDALGVVMAKQGVGNTEASEIIKVMKPHFDPRNIRAGQKIAMSFDEAENNTQAFREMKMRINPLKTLVVARAGDGFKADIDEKEVKKVIRAKKTQVDVSLAGSAAKSGIPQSVIAEAIRIYSWNVDFQRDIRPKNKLEVMYESYETDTGHVAKNGNILYAKLTLDNREIPLYRFKMADGRVDYFQPDGRSVKRTLMKTPIKGARMSSGFGMRRHPVLGYNKMHRGVDFAARTGTPIFAAGDGVIEKAGWFSSYGKYVRIRHNSKLKTAYAHMSKIKPAVKIGSRVTQGQVIGYVGTTGRSTGPHLHYEVLSGGRQVNPRSVNLPVGEELVGGEKQKFKAVMNDMRGKFATALAGTRVAKVKNNQVNKNQLN
jgi:murein DD-endopeptidase MepM/ murein hydrolase activator NlpD